MEAGSVSHFLRRESEANQAIGRSFLKPKGAKRDFSGTSDRFPFWVGQSSQLAEGAALSGNLAKRDSNPNVAKARVPW